MKLEGPDGQYKQVNNYIEIIILKNDQEILRVLVDNYSK